MGTVNFSVPDKVKKAFNKAFTGENKSAILSRLMQEAVDERDRRRRRAAAIDRLIKLRKTQRPVTDSQIRRARHQGRP